MDVSSITVCLPVKTSAAAIEWYRSLFGAKACINPATGVFETEIATSVWLQLIDGSASEEPANVLRVGVSDIDAELQRLNTSGICFDAPIELNLTEGVLRLCYLSDPDGNRLCLYQFDEALPLEVSRREQGLPE